MCIDLHIHSHFSDGTHTPAELIMKAKSANLSALALTDHDTVQGLDDFLAAAKIHDLPVVTGLEISSTFNNHSVHILGYGMDHRNESFVKWLKRLQEGREERNEKIIDKLRQLGIEISDSELKDLSRHGQTGRPHIARLLVQKGIAASRDDAFRLYLKKGAAAWTGRFTYSAEESIRMIHHAGGIAVLAHPGHISPPPQHLHDFIGKLVALGLDGLEAYYPGYTNQVRKSLRNIADRHKLVITGGSDYHGENKEYSKMAGKKSGFCPPDSLLPRLYEKLNIY